MTAEALREHLRDAVALAERAGPIALKYFRTAVAVDDKPTASHYDPVTAADREIERFLRTELHKKYPGYAILGEEEGMDGPDTAKRWVIDPIDGTRAFISGMPAWGILLGLAGEDGPVVGVMHQPYVGETFSGVSGQGAWLRRGGVEVGLETRKHISLGDAVLYCTHPYMFPDDAQREAFMAVARISRMTRFGGDCYSYCLLAMGQIDLVIEGGLHPYDIIPLIPIIEAAGGVVTNSEGGPADAGGFIVAAGDPALHAAALETIDSRMPR